MCERWQTVGSSPRVCSHCDVTGRHRWTGSRGRCNDPSQTVSAPLAAGTSTGQTNTSAIIKHNHVHYNTWVQERPAVNWLTFTNPLPVNHRCHHWWIQGWGAILPWSPSSHMQWPIWPHSSLKHVGYKPDAACEHDNNIQKHEIFNRKFCTWLPKRFQLQGTSPLIPWPGLLLLAPGPRCG